MFRRQLEGVSKFRENECYFHKLEKKIKGWPGFLLIRLHIFFLLLPNQEGPRKSYFGKAQACSTWYINFKEQEGNVPVVQYWNISHESNNRAECFCVFKMLSPNLSVSSLHPAPGVGWRKRKKWQLVPWAALWLLRQQQCGVASTAPKVTPSYLRTLALAMY